MLTFVLSLGLIAAAQTAAVASNQAVEPSPEVSANWACDLQTFDNNTIKVNVVYNATNKQVTVNLPSINNNFTREAKFDDQNMMWTEKPEVGNAVLWTIVRATREIRLTRIIGTTVRVNSGQCHAPELAQ